MNINEGLINTILGILKQDYPNMVETTRFGSIDTLDGHKTMFFLAESELITSGEISRRGDFPEMLEAKITAKGLEHIESSTYANNLKTDQSLISDTEALKSFVTQVLSSTKPIKQETKLAIDNLQNFNNREMSAFTIKLIKLAVKDQNSIISILRSEK